MKIPKSYQWTYPIFLLALGIYSVLHSKVQLLPNVEPPKVTFSVKWPGASANLLLTRVVQPYEQALQSKLDGLDSLEVTLKEEQVTFQATFDFATKLDRAEQNIRELLSRTRPLPLNVPAISYRQGGRNISNRVVGSYFITSQQGQFSEAQKQVIASLADKQLAHIHGIDKVELNPKLQQQLVFTLDPMKMAHYAMSYQQVRQVIRNVFNEPTGTLYENGKMIRMQYAGLHNIADFEQATVDFVNGIAIRLTDLATIEVQPIRTTASVRFNGQPALSMRVLRQSDANLLDMQQAIDQLLVKNQRILAPAGLDVHLSFDTALFIERAISWMIASIAAGFILSLLVSYAFLRRISPTILGGIITLLSVSGVMVVLNLLSVSINVISLAGITFAIGMFVDGVLIVSEHLDRTGDTDKDKISQRVWELAPALTASVLTSVVVFAPLIFNHEAEGQLFSGLAIAISAGLVIALTLTLLFTPVFAYHFIKPRPFKQIRPNRLLTQLNEKTNSAMIRRLLLVLFGIGAVVLTLVLFPAVSFLPSIKRDAIDVFMPQSGSDTVETIERNFVSPLSDALSQDPAIPATQNAYALGWSHFVTAAVRLHDSDQLPTTLAHLRKTLPAQFEGNRVVVMQGNLFGGLEDNNSIKLQLFVEDASWLSAQSKAVEALIEDNVESVSVRFSPNLAHQKATLRLSPKTDNLREMAISEQELKVILQSISDNDFAGIWNYQGKSLQAYIRLNHQGDLDNYRFIPVVTAKGVHTFLGELVNFEQTKVLPPLKRINGQSAITVSIAITDKLRTVSQVMEQLNAKVLPQLNQMIGQRGHIQIKGSAASLAKAKRFLSLMLIFSLLAFLLIVSVTYRSLKLGIYVLCTLPVALTGGVIGFRLLNSISPQSFDVLTLIGFMIMLGIVANNAILLVDAMNKNYRKGATLADAVAQANAVRFRPIMVSTITTVAGMLPLLLLPSQASVIYRGIAAVVIGGVIANLLSVFIVTSAMVKHFGLRYKGQAKEQPPLPVQSPMGATSS
jgi:multidrug efflux pump subunit AcrB